MGGFEVRAGRRKRDGENLVNTIPSRDDGMEENEWF